MQITLLGAAGSDVTDPRTWFNPATPTSWWTAAGFRARRGWRTSFACDDFFLATPVLSGTSATSVWLAARDPRGVRCAARAARRGADCNPEEVAEKILRHSEALGGISGLMFQMNVASLPHAKLMRANEAI
jgi:hypothetical protein